MLRQSDCFAKTPENTPNGRGFESLDIVAIANTL